jgi:HAD superfamily hydrolase (TIGR01509 family)
VLRAEQDRLNLWRLVPEGVREAVAGLRAAGIPVGLVSNSEGQLGALLERVGLGQAFDVVLDSGIEGVRKPDPEIFLRACSRIGVEPADALYAGDIPEIDVQGAHGAGLRAALVDPYGLYPSFDAAPRFSSVPELASAILALRQP